ncbi:MAG: type IV pilus twitching motility protein PilT [Elusimicrobia bacterium]|nr:type IV pilus twitching motility protein PilT [Elusimicrobiota bacterium]
MPELLDVLKATAQMGASDLHLVVGKPPMVRLQGLIRPMPGAAPVTAEESKQMVYSVLYEEQRARFESCWELDCSIALAGISRFRVNVFLQKNGVSAVFRTIPSHIPTPAELGLMPAMANLVDLPRGLVLVTGPTGSGKSTTLASLIELINQKQQKHILTIEDPIEFVYEDKNSIIVQREVGQHTKSFSEALRHALRQDPDAILIGELRDLETIALAISAAETGHLCFATLHTQDCPTTIDRLIDVFPPSQQQQVRVQISTELQAVICQTLLPRKDGQGRICAREFLRVTSAVGNIIREGKTHLIYAAIEAGNKYGMISMDQYLALLVKQNLVSIENAMNAAHDASTVRKLAGMPEAGAAS